MSLSAPIKCSLPTSTSITVCNGFHTCCLSTQETKNSSHDRLLMSVLQQQKVTWQLICQWRRTYKLSCDVTTTYAKIQQSQIRIETIWWNSPTVWLHDFQSRRDDQVEPWKLHWINPPHLSEMKRKGPRESETRATSRRGESGSVQGHCSSALLSNQVFADSRPHPGQGGSDAS